MSYVAEFISFIQAYPHLAYGAALLLAFCESLPLLGAVVPGTAIIIGLAALVPSGVLKLAPLVAAATTGAMLGDGLSFWLGRRYNRQILHQWPFHHYPEVIERSEAFFRKHGTASVFLARFVPGIRAFVPLVAGILQMPARRFYLVNILSAIVWAPSHILPGVLLGAFVHSAGAAAGRLAILIGIVLVLLWATVRLVRLGIGWGVPLLHSGLNRLAFWSNSHDNWLTRRISALVDRSKRETAVLAGLAFLLIASGWLFVEILDAVVNDDAIVNVDLAIYQFLQKLRTPLGDSLMVGVTELGDTRVVIAVTAAVLLWLVWKRAWGTAAYWLAAVAVASSFNTVIKAAVHRSRPVEELYAGWSNFSFPSGHSTTNAALYGFLAFLICRRLSLVQGVLVAFAATAIAVLIGFSRVYLGAHWFSDVAGGLAFAASWLTLLSIAYMHHRSSDEATDGLLVVAVVAVTVAGGFNIYSHHATDMKRYAIRYEAPLADVADWWGLGWQSLPQRRIDFTGEVEEPLTLQWAGTVAELEANLAKAGWRPPVPWSVTSALQWLSPGVTPLQLPVFPSLDRGHMPSLVLVRADSKNEGTSRYVLRLWITDKRSGDMALWVGSVVEEQLSHRLLLFTYPVTSDGMNRPRDILLPALPGARLAYRQDFDRDGEWDGGVVLSRGSSSGIE
ncbi:VTT domain-containing protein [Rhizobiaceae bacterium n13]|uniref:VTT domain-containing protein n=1 Tax=Ferirhizobium litorale TaxID=2927786 RepID=A0AAE3U0A3_9HYPH|nr:VTT domain-containing protein [Fererhizobium litorale]MDI7860969.1 VTT domain-containing protein [Fererhizobium litorale]MDI7921116.1 VTT domain-containing protein [Fererhizobium litorale]